MSLNVFHDALQVGDLANFIIRDVQAELMFQFQDQIRQFERVSKAAQRRIEFDAFSEVLLRDD